MAGGAIGRREDVAAITSRAMNGEIDFAGALKARVALLKGQPESLLASVAERVTLMPGAPELLAALTAQGVACWLVSGGFTCFAEPVAARLGFTRVYANTLVVRDGVITGEVRAVTMVSGKPMLRIGTEEVALSDVSRILMPGEPATVSGTGSSSSSSGTTTTTQGTAPIG